MAEGSAPEEAPTLGEFCLNCRFHSEAEGLCRRDPPRPRYVANVVAHSDYLRGLGLPEGDGNTACWPEVHPRDWCGEFSPALREPRAGWLCV